VALRCYATNSSPQWLNCLDPIMLVAGPPCCGVPMVRAEGDRDLDSLKKVVAHGGASLPADLARKLLLVFLSL
jgi:hypothetical protein